MKYFFFFNNSLFLRDFYFFKKEKSLCLINLNKNYYRKYKNIFYVSFNNFFLKLIQLILKGGLKEKFFLKILIVFKYFFFLFLKKFSHFFKNKNFYIMISSFFKFILNFHDINFVLYWILLIIKPTFFIKCVQIDKKYRKKFKKRFNFKFVYIIQKKRENIALRWLFLNTCNYNGLNFFEKFLKNLLDTFLNGKKSQLFLKKKFILKKVFKKTQI